MARPTSFCTASRYATLGFRRGDELKAVRDVPGEMLNPEHERGLEDAAR